METVDTATMRNTTIGYYLSNDGAAEWYRAYSGKTVVFPASGADLRWKAEFSTLSPVITPVLHRIDIDTDTSTIDTELGGIPNSIDTDNVNDGLSDVVEARLGTDPLVFDDQVQSLTGTAIDSDGDGLSGF